MKKKNLRKDILERVVVLDSSILNRDRSCNGLDMNLFVKWASLNLICWHVPWVVYKEVVSKGLLETNQLFEDLKKKIKDVLDLGQSDNITKIFESIREKINMLSSDFESNNEKYWKSFFKDAVIDDFDCSTSQNVLNSYFSGYPPFSSPKCRRDIPDAFIYDEIKKLASKYEIFFICGDNNLRKYCESLENVQCYGSLNEFQNSKFGRSINQQYENIIEYQHKVDLVLQYKNEILKYAEEDIQGDLLVYLGEGFSNDSIPSDDNEGCLVGISEIQSIEIEESDIAYVDDVIYVPISVKTQFDIEYFLFKADYPVYEDRQISFEDWDWNRHYHLVRETFDAKFKFTYSIDEKNVKSGNLNLTIPNKLDELILKPIFRQNKDHHY